MERKGRKNMTTILKMIFSIVKTVFTIFWKIVKHLAGPMRESCKSLWKVGKMLYQNHQEKKAAGVAVTEGKGNEVVAGAAESTIATQEDEKARVVPRVRFLEAEANFKADEGTEGAQKAKNMFANLWKSGITGKVVIGVAVIVLYKVVS